jgi:hypothetical protein
LKFINICNSCLKKPSNYSPPLIVWQIRKVRHSGFRWHSLKSCSLYTVELGLNPAWVHISQHWPYWLSGTAVIQWQLSWRTLLKSLVSRFYFSLGLLFTIQVIAVTVWLSQQEDSKHWNLNTNFSDWYWGFYILPNIFIYLP